MSESCAAGFAVISTQLNTYLFELDTFHLSHQNIILKIIVVVAETRPGIFKWRMIKVGENYKKVHQQNHLEKKLSITLKSCLIHTAQCLFLFGITWLLNSQPLPPITHCDHVELHSALSFDKAFQQNSRHHNNSITLNMLNDP